MTNKTYNEFVDEINEVEITARDTFYEQLIIQEVRMFIILVQQSNDKDYLIDEDEVNFIIERRGFNELESSCLRQLVYIINKYVEVIQQNND